MGLGGSVTHSSGFLVPKEPTYQNLKEIMYRVYKVQSTFLLSKRDMELHLRSRYSTKTYTSLCLCPRSLEDHITTFTIISGIPGLVCDQ